MLVYKFSAEICQNILRRLKPGKLAKAGSLNRTWWLHWYGATKFISKVLIIIACLFQINIAFASGIYQLVFAVDLIRHGDRTPAITLPKDPHHWKEGLNQLTPKGMSQLYLVGKSLRENYIEQYHLLEKHYITDALYVRSTDYDRTLISAEALLLGLYPLGTGPKSAGQAFSLPEGYQPIAIHTVKFKQDNLLLPSSVNNQQFQALLKQYVYSQPAWLIKEKLFDSKLQAWSQQTGYKMHKLKDIIPLGDALYIRKLYGIPPPPGMSDRDANEIISLEQWVLINKFVPMPIGKFMAKQFWIELKNNLQEAIDDNTHSQLRYIIYLGHESNILGLFSALGLPLQVIPAYGADLRFELLKDDKKQFWVRISYNHQIQKLPGCMNVCSIEQFFKLIQ